MANTREEIIEMLTIAGYNLQDKGDKGFYFFIRGIETYWEPSGFDTAFIIVRLSPSGKHIDIFSPLCF